MRQKRLERFWTASAGREAANPMDGVSKVSTVKPGISKANNLALRWLNALSSAKGPGISKANNLALLWLNGSSSAKGMGFRNANSFAFRQLNALSSAKGSGIKNATNVALLAVTRRRNGPLLCEGHQGYQLASPVERLELFIYRDSDAELQVTLCGKSCPFWQQSAHSSQSGQTIVQYLQTVYRVWLCNLIK